MCESDMHIQWRGFLSLFIFGAWHACTCSALGASRFEGAQWVLVRELFSLISNTGLLLQEFSYVGRFCYILIYPSHLLSLLSDKNRR